MNKIILAVSLIPAVSFGANCTSFAAGDALNPLNWTNCGGGVPTTGDTATITHVMTAASWTLGASITPTSETNAIALTITSPGRLRVDVFADVRGDTVLSNAELEIAPGAVFEMNSSLTASPSTTFYRLFNGAASGQTSARVINNGTIRSNVGGAYGEIRPTTGSTNTGLITSNGGTFLRLGSASRDAIVMSSTGAIAAGYSFTSTTFDNCGRVHHSSNVGTATPFVMVDVKFQNSLHTNSFRLIQNSSPTAARTMTRVYFDKPPAMDWANFTISQCYFANGWTNLAADAWALMEKTLLRYTGTSGVVPRGNMQHVYVLNDTPASNPHTLVPDSALDFTMIDSVFEYTGADSQGDFFYTGTTKNITLERNIWLPNTNQSIGTAVSWNGSGLLTMRHNTILAGAQSPAYEDSGSIIAGGLADYRSNLIWATPTSVINDNSVQARQKFIYYYPALLPGASTPDPFAVVSGVARADYNYGWNLKAGTFGGGYSINQPTGTVGANDINDTSPTGPGFVDSSRNFASWAVTRGSAGSTAAQKITDGLSYIVADPTLVYSSLLPYIRSGFAPTNPILQNAGHDGVTIGAVEFQIASSVTMHLYNPQASPVLVVSTISSATPPEITFMAPHGLVVDDRLYCVGFSGLPRANRLLKVKSTPTGTSITVKYDNDVDVAGPTAATTHSDIDTRTAGSQLGYCGKTQALEPAAHPKGWWSPSGAANTRVKDPDGVGGGVAPVVTADAPGWSFLVSQNDLFSTPSGCDGLTIGLCPVEESLIVNGTYQVSEGWPAQLLAFGWYADNSRVRWKMAAIYLLRNLHRVTPIEGTHTACDVTAYYCGRGEENDYAGFMAGQLATAFSFLRGQPEVDSAFTTTFVQKLFNDESNGCTNMLPPLSGMISAVGGSGVVTGIGFTAGFSAGDWLYIKLGHRVYTPPDGSLVNITVASNIATVTVAAGYPIPGNGTDLTIAGSGVSGLDGSYGVASGSGVSFTFATIGVADGVYNAAGMTVRAYGSINSTGGWYKVISVNSDAQMTLSPSILSRQVNAPYAKVSTWSSTSCGLLWFRQHHLNAPVSPDSRFISFESTVAREATTAVVSAGTYNNIVDLAVPFFVSATGETMQVTAKNDATRALTIVRGVGLTPRRSHTASEIVAWQSFGPNTSFGGSASTKSIGNPVSNLTHRGVAGLITAASIMADDSPRARELMMYYGNMNTMWQRETLRGMWSASPNAGPAAPGYFNGAWADMMGWSALVFRNSFSQPIDYTTGFPGLINSQEFLIHISRSDDPSKHIPYADSGSQRSAEKDDRKLIESSPYLFPVNAPRLLDFERIRGHIDRETIVLRLMYGGVAVADYKTLPTRRLFTATGKGMGASAPFTLGGLTFRQDWTSPIATVGVCLIATGDDHLASYVWPCTLLLTKGPAELIGGSADRFASFGDLRTLNSVEVNAGTSSLTGGLLAPAAYTATNGPAFSPRGTVDPNFGAYMRTVNQRYSPTLSITSAHRDIVYLAPPSGQDYVITHDSLFASVARNMILRIPYYLYNNTGTAPQSPAATFSRTGEDVMFTTGNGYNVQLRSKVYVPTTAQATYTEDTSSVYSHRLVVSTNGTVNDFLVLHQPCVGVCVAPVTNALLTSSSTHRAVQVVDSANAWIVIFAKSQNDISTSITYTALSHTGNARHVITGLPLGNTWTVKRDSVDLLTGQTTDDSGVLSFSSAFGAGEFEIMVTGSTPPPNPGGGGPGRITSGTVTQSGRTN